MGKLIAQSDVRVEPKQQAFPYQQQAAEAVRDLEYAAVFHEQGLGKTKIAIDVALYWIEKRIVDTVLIVAKKGLIRNWQREFGVHTHLHPRVLDQSHSGNFHILNSPVRVLLTHYEVLVSEKERLKLFLKARDVGVILDESAKIKNPDASVTQVSFELAALFKRRIIMTGTPVANRPYDIWSQIWFLDQGKALGGDFDRFKSQVDLSPELATDLDAQAEFEGHLSTIFGKVSAFSVRETKRSGIIELPQKIINTVETTWEDSQYSLYCQYRNDLRAVVVRDGIPTEDKAEGVLSGGIGGNPRRGKRGVDAHCRHQYV
jgi:SNF2 family DNA or RNA helicase